MPIFSVVFTYFNYSFDMFSSKENQRYYGFVFTWECVGPTDLSCFADKTYVGGCAFIHRQQTICCISAQTKLSSIYRHELIVIYCALMKHQALLTIQAKLKLATKLTIIICFAFRSWYNLANSSPRWGKLWNLETQLYPNLVSPN